MSTQEYFVRWRAYVDGVVVEGRSELSWGIGWATQLLTIWRTEDLEEGFWSDLWLEPA